MTWRMLVAALALTGCDNSTPRPVPRAVTRPGDAAVSADAATEAAPFYSIGEAVGDAKASQLEFLGYKPWRDLNRPACVYKNDRVVVVDERCELSTSNECSLWIFGPKGSVWIRGGAKGIPQGTSTRETPIAAGAVEDVATWERTVFRGGRKPPQQVEELLGRIPQDWPWLCSELARRR